ncbi:hypothetical protein BH10BAC5_BH10BAC5_27570 [soil metagenome]
MKPDATGTSSVVVIVGYRPKPEKVKELHQLMREHYSVLKKEGLVTERVPVLMEAEDGTIIEVFEWKSNDSIKEAHSNPEIGKLWKRYDECCEYVPLGGLKEATDIFANFKPFE